MTQVVAKTPRGFYYFSFFYFFLLTDNTQAPPYFHWNYLLKNIKQFYFYWNNIVFSKNKKEGTYICNNQYIKSLFRSVYL